MVFGLRVKEEEEREGLDITSHGEAAYESWFRFVIVF
jgi:Amt family ammonium transporter